MTNFTALAAEIHASNVTAGWWTDPNSGADIRGTRNRGEMLMLAVTECIEATESGPDDKLPQFPMFDVELGDFVIRQLDQIGSELALGAAEPVWTPYPVDRDEMLFSGRAIQLLCILKHLAWAMEDYRKGRIDAYVQQMADGVTLAFRLAEINGIDLPAVIAAKRAFNATREDHKLENRVKPGGKAI